MPSCSRTGHGLDTLNRSRGKSCTWLTCSQGDVLHATCGHHFDNCPKQTAWDSWAGCIYRAPYPHNLVTRGFGAIWQSVSLSAPECKLCLWEVSGLEEVLI